METFLGIEYTTWWFIVVGFLFAGYAVLDGFDFGAGAWHLFFKEDVERRTALNAVGPVWDGNEVWLVIAGGALFAGFPIVYASVFSAMYIPFMLFLLFIIFRAVSIEFRSKEKMIWWRKFWDVSYSISSIMLALLLGVVLGNVLQGIALDADFEYSGGALFAFLSPYALLVGLTTLSLFMMHGAIFLLLKTEGTLYQKLLKFQRLGMLMFVITFALTTIVTLIFKPHLTDKFLSKPVLFLIPILAFLSIFFIYRKSVKEKFSGAFFFSALTIVLLLTIVAVELFPVLMFSSLDPANNLTVYNASSSEKTLGIMLTIVAIGTPLIAVYTYFVYKTFRGKVKIDEMSY